MPLTDPSHDLALLADLRRGGAGASAAFTALYQRHQAPLYRYAALRSGSNDLAADVVQELFMALMTDALKFDAARGSLQPFLFGVARKLLLKRNETERRYVSNHYVSSYLHDDAGNDHDDSAEWIADESATPLERVLADERAEHVRHALAQVAPHYRDVLILYEIHDLSYVEIADICGIDLGTVRSRLSRARGKLTQLLAPTIEPELTAQQSQ
jgi:RNA polymerase sigma-70 factor, ECF subfamily